MRVTKVRGYLASSVGALGHGCKKAVSLAVRPVMDVLIGAYRRKCGRSKDLEVRGVLGSTNSGAALRGHFGLIHGAGEKNHFL